MPVPLKALQQAGRDRIEDCYQHVNVLKEQLQELRNRFKFSNSTRVVHCTQNQMQQVCFLALGWVLLDFVGLHVMKYFI